MRFFVLLMLLFLVACGHGTAGLPRVTTLGQVSHDIQGLMSWLQVVAMLGMGAGVFIGIISRGMNLLAWAMIGSFGFVFTASTVTRYLDPFMPWIIGTLIAVFFVWLMYHVWHHETSGNSWKEEFEGLSAEVGNVRAVIPTMQKELDSKTLQLAIVKKKLAEYGI